MCSFLSSAGNMHPLLPKEHHVPQIHRNLEIILRLDTANEVLSCPHEAALSRHVTRPWQPCSQSQMNQFHSDLVRELYLTPNSH